MPDQPIPQLLPCPFCGGAADVWEEWRYFGMCEQCHVRGRNERTIDAAARAWNEQPRITQLQRRAARWKDAAKYWRQRGRRNAVMFRRRQR